MRRASLLLILGALAGAALLGRADAAPGAGAIPLLQNLLQDLPRAERQADDEKASAQPRPTARKAAPLNDPSALCDRAIAAAAARHGAPERLLRSIALVESGRSRNGETRPWPWTVNMEGEGRWFESRAEALAFVRARQAKGAKSFDLGCLQVNHYWHGEAFESLEAMIEPDANADYAARYLAALKQETGDWMRAAGYYHSRTPKPFQRYSAKIAEAYETAAARRLTPAAEIEAQLEVSVVADPAPAGAPEDPARRPRSLFDQGRPPDDRRFSGLLRLAASSPIREPAAAGLLSDLPAARAAPRGGVSAGGVGLAGIRGGDAPSPLLAPAARPLLAPDRARP